MRKVYVPPKRPTGWRYEGWRSCADVDGVPRWFRCQRCNALVTHGHIQLGGCGACGTRRLMPAQILSWSEILALKLGRYPFTATEAEWVRPLIRHIVTPRGLVPQGGGRP